MKLSHTFESQMVFDNGTELRFSAVHPDNNPAYIHIDTDDDISGAYSPEEFKMLATQCQLILDKLDNVRMEEKL